METKNKTLKFLYHELDFINENKRRFFNKREIKSYIFNNLKYYQETKSEWKTVFKILFFNFDHFFNS